MPTWEQVKGATDRLVAMLLVWLVAKGYIAGEDAATVGAIIIGLLSLAWGAWVNRPKALVQSAAAVPGTTIVTTADLAAATPGQANIMSATTNVITRKG